MAMFLVRVELHQASWSDYETLHNAMAAEGFSRTIQGSDGIEYSLPTAEYTMTADLTCEAVLAKAKNAASKTRKSYGVIVAEATRMMWSGLPKVNALVRR